MITKKIFELRKQGLTEQAYNAARQTYAVDKSPRVSSAMFWTAVDMLKTCVAEGRIDEATKILMAIDRLLPNVPDKEGEVKEAYERCGQLIKKKHTKKAGFNEISEHIQTGIWGEEVAVDFLLDSGYIILERDWHSGHRDIDIIARQSNTIVFIEVKTRHDNNYMEPELAVDWRKSRNLQHAINHYIKYRKIDNPIRFDIITVVGSPGTPHPIINHIEDVDIMR